MSSKNNIPATKILDNPMRKRRRQAANMEERNEKSPIDVQYDEQKQCFVKHIQRKTVVYTRRAYPLDPGEDSDSDSDEEDYYPYRHQPEV